MVNDNTIMTVVISFFKKIIVKTIFNTLIHESQLRRDTLHAVSRSLLWLFKNSWSLIHISCKRYHSVLLLHIHPIIRNWTLVLMLYLKQGTPRYFLAATKTTFVSSLLILFPNLIVPTPTRLMVIYSWLCQK